MYFQLEPYLSTLDPYKQLLFNISTWISISKTDLPQPLLKNCPSILFSVSINSNSFLSVARARNLGVIFNFFLFSYITTNTQETLWFNLQNISRIFTSDPLYIPVQSIITYLLEFCNSTLAGLLAFSWAPFSLFSI